MSSPPERDQLFISYSRADRKWVDRLQMVIRPLVRSHGLRLWDDSQIEPGDKWREEIETALATAKVALLLVSTDFLASEFVNNSELPQLLKAAEEEGMRILWVPLWPSLVRFTPIQEYQPVLDPGRPLAAMSRVKREEALVTIALAIEKALAPRQDSPPGEGAKTRGERRSLQVERSQEQLGVGVALTLVKIPAGTFLMGSPENEPQRLDSEGPQHEVTLCSFIMAQTPITQAQWRAVAGWQKVERDLKPDPSMFKGPNRPVERVSWFDAVEFCRRLSQRTGKRYGLPSEAQWEYACRAGSPTPFHFGATLTPELANYDGNDTYGDGPKGTYREQTTDVASFLANAWGLHDLHGNVWEWCEDHWHATYDIAPGDDQPWLIPAAIDGVPRLLRGGSWDCFPAGCRSAFRLCFPPNFRSFNIGFRVCCLPQV